MANVRGTVFSACNTFSVPQDWCLSELTIPTFSFYSNNGAHQRIQYILIIKPTRCTNFSNLFLEQNSICFGQSFATSRSFITVHTAMVFVILILLASCLSKPVWYKPMLSLQWKTPDDGLRNCPKHVEFNSKSKLEKLEHLVGIIIRIYHDTRSP